MSTFFSFIIANAVPAILGWLAGIITKMIHSWTLNNSEKAATDAKNAEARAALENAKTKEERDAAAADVSSKF